MDVPDLISPDVWEMAGKAFANQENYVVYNNTMLFVTLDDIRFFSNPDDAEEFVFDNINNLENWRILKIDSLDHLKSVVESIIPGLKYPVPITESVIKGAISTFFPEKELKSKTTIIMDIQRSMEQLTKKLLFLGFGEGLNSELERKLKEGKPSFTLQASSEFGKDKMGAVLNFTYAAKDGKENYFLNNYVATLVSHPDKPSQFVYVNNRGQSITFKEACNLLNDRFVFKTLTSKTGVEYDTWVKLDKNNLDQRTGYPKLHQFGEKYGFDVNEALNRLPFKCLQYEPELKSVLRSLEKGNNTAVVLLHNESEHKVFIEANPPAMTLNMYDADGNKLDFPMKKVEQKYGQAAKAEEAVAEKEVKYRKRNLLAKKREPNNLIPKKGTGRSTRKKIQ